MSDHARLSLLDLPARRTTLSTCIGFVDRGTDPAELNGGPKNAQFGASSARLANTWQYMPLGWV
jgi:hypothetical protein